MTFQNQGADCIIGAGHGGGARFLVTGKQVELGESSHGILQDGLSQIRSCPPGYAGHQFRPDQRRCGDPRLPSALQHLQRLVLSHHLPGRPEDVGHRRAHEAATHNFALVEAHQGAATVPAEFSGSDARCGLIAIWTDRGMGLPLKQILETGGG